MKFDHFSMKMNCFNRNFMLITYLCTYVYATVSGSVYSTAVTSYIYNPLCISRLVTTYRKQGKICWAKLLHFSFFLGVTRKFFREYKHLSLIVLNNEHLWPRQHESISVKTLMALKPPIFSPANLSRLRYIQIWL